MDLVKKPREIRSPKVERLDAASAENSELEVHFDLFQLSTADFSHSERFNFLTWARVTQLF
jgi:hypothetical protein